MVVVRKLTNVGVYLGVGYLVPQLDAFLFKYQIQGDIAEKPWTGVSGVDGCKNINFLDEKHGNGTFPYFQMIYTVPLQILPLPPIFCWSA